MPVTHEQAKAGAGKVVVGRRHENETFKIMMRQHTMSFMEADLNGDGCIDEAEFMLALPDHVKQKHTEAEMKGWFKMLDRNGNGMVDRDEHLRWALNAASIASGAGIGKAFAKYDRDNSGTLTELEFCRAARDVGVGDYAEQLFRTLPGCEDGEVRYMDLVDAAGDKSKFTPDELKSFIVAMAWNTTKDMDDVDTSGWSFTADDVEGFRLALVELLTSHNARLSKIFEKIDRNDDNLVSHEEFIAVCNGMLGFKGRREVLDATFRELDDDRSGQVQYDEINAWLAGKATAKHLRMQRVRSMKLIVPLQGPEGSDGSWTPDQLREELLEHLTAIGCETTDLLEMIGAPCARNPTIAIQPPNSPCSSRARYFHSVRLCYSHASRGHVLPRPPFLAQIRMVMGSSRTVSCSGRSSRWWPISVCGISRFGQRWWPSARSLLRKDRERRFEPSMRTASTSSCGSGNAQARLHPAPDPDRGAALPSQKEGPRSRAVTEIAETRRRHAIETCWMSCGRPAKCHGPPAKCHGSPPPPAHNQCINQLGRGSRRRTPGIRKGIRKGIRTRKGT